MPVMASMITGGRGAIQKIQEPKQPRRNPDSNRPELDCLGRPRLKYKVQPVRRLATRLPDLPQFLSQQEIFKSEEPFPGTSRQKS